MSNYKTTIWDNKVNQQFAKVLVDINDAKKMQNFLRDVMTESEIIEISSRLQAACMLQAGIKYTEIMKITNLSSRTIARISSWINNGCNGYTEVISQINHQNHIPPVSAE